VLPVYSTLTVIHNLCKKILVYVSHHYHPTRSAVLSHWFIRKKNIGNSELPYLCEATYSSVWFIILLKQCCLLDMQSSSSQLPKKKSCLWWSEYRYGTYGWMTRWPTIQKGGIFISIFPFDVSIHFSPIRKDNSKYGSQTLRQWSLLRSKKMRQ